MDSRDPMRLSGHTVHTVAARVLLPVLAVPWLLLPGCGGETVERKRSLSEIKEIISSSGRRVEEGRTLNTTVLQGAEIGIELEMTFGDGTSHPIKTYRFESVSSAESALARNKYGLRDGYWIFVGMDKRTRKVVRKALRSGG